MAPSGPTSTSKAPLGHLCRAVAVWLCTFSVTQATPDLTITDIREKDSVIRYDLKNQGTSLAPASHVTSLSVDGSPKDTDSISVAIQPGKVCTGSFAKYKWQCLQDGKHTVQVKAESADASGNSVAGNVAGFTTQSRTLPMPDLIVSRLWREDHKTRLFELGARNP